MLLLLHLEDSTILEGPLDNVSLGRNSLDPFALVEGRVEVAKVLKLDEMPDGAEGSLNDSRLDDRGGGGNARRHCELSSREGLV